MSAFTNMPKPKPNAEAKACTNWILFVSISVAEFKQILLVLLIQSALTQPRGLFMS